MFRERDEAMVRTTTSHDASPLPIRILLLAQAVLNLLWGGIAASDADAAGIGRGGALAIGLGTAMVLLALVILIGTQRPWVRIAALAVEGVSAASSLFGLDGPRSLVFICLANTALAVGGLVLLARLAARDGFALR